MEWKIIIDFVSLVLLVPTTLFLVKLIFAKKFVFEYFNSRRYFLPTQKNSIESFMKWVTIGFAFLLFLTAIHYLFSNQGIKFWDEYIYWNVLLIVLEAITLFSNEQVILKNEMISFGKEKVFFKEVKKIELWDNVVIFLLKGGKEVDLGIHAYPKKQQQNTVFQLITDLKQMAQQYSIKVDDYFSSNQEENVMMV